VHAHVLNFPVPTTVVHYTIEVVGFYIHSKIHLDKRLKYFLKASVFSSRTAIKIYVNRLLSEAARRVLVLLLYPNFAMKTGGFFRLENNIAFDVGIRARGHGIHYTAHHGAYQRTLI
jgi:hypothetical protein